MRHLKFNGNFGELKNQGFRYQKLFAGDEVYYIRDVPDNVIDNSLFIRKSGGIIRSFIVLDFGSLTMGKHFGETDGYVERNKFLQDIDIDQLREEVMPEAKLVQAIQAGAFEGDLSDFIDHNYKNQELLSLGYDVISHSVVTVPVWRGHFMDPKRPTNKLNIVSFMLFQYHFDWLYQAVKDGIVVIPEKV